MRVHQSGYVCVRVDTRASEWMCVHQSGCVCIWVDACTSEWMCVHLSLCVCIRVYTWCVCSTLGDQKVFDPLELELQTFVNYPMWVLGIKLISCTRAAGVHNEWAISSPLVLFFVFEVIRIEPRGLYAKHALYPASRAQEGNKFWWKP